MNDKVKCGSLNLITFNRLNGEKEIDVVLDKDENKIYYIFEKRNRTGYVPYGNNNQELMKFLNCYRKIKKEVKEYKLKLSR